MAGASNPNNLRPTDYEQGGYYAQPHQFKFLGSYLIPVIDVQIAVNGKAMSGPNIIGYFYAYDIPGLSYAYFYDWEGRLKGNARYEFDVRIEKVFRVGDCRAAREILEAVREGAEAALTI